MNFYFCEKCGKRVTEKDIEQGAGKNKKLKGVFCSACAVGVMTMESLPMTDEEAKRILAPTAKPKTSPSTGSLQKKTSRPSSRDISTVSASAQRGRRGDKRDSQAKPGEKKGKPLPVLPIMLGAATLVFAIIFFATSNRQPKKTTSQVRKKNRTLSTKAGSFDLDRPMEKNDVDKSIGSAQKPKASKGIEDTIGSTEPTRTGSKAEREAFVGFQKQIEGFSDDDFKARIEAGKAFLEAFPMALEASKVRTGIQSWVDAEKQRTQNTDVIKQTGESPAPLGAKSTQTETGRKLSPDAAVAVGPKRPDGAKYQVAFNAKLNVFLERLKERDLDGASKLAEEMKRSEAFEAWGGASKELPAIVGLLINQEKQKQEKFQKQVGKTLRLQLQKGKRPLNVKVLRVKGNTFKAMSVFTINGKTKNGSKLTFLLSDLTSASQRRLLPSRKPASAKDWISIALLSLSHFRLDEFEAALTKGDAAEMSKPLKWRLGQEKWDERERVARQAWEDFALKAGGDVQEEQAKLLFSELSSLEDRYKGTYLLWSIKKDIKTLRERLAYIAEARDKRLAALFNGKVLSVNAKERKISVVYDFSDARQLNDFIVTPGRNALASDGLLIKCSAIANRPLVAKRFDPFFLSIRMHYKMLSTTRRTFGIWLGLPKPIPNRKLPYENAGVILQSNMSGELVLGTLFLKARNNAYFAEKRDLPQEGILELRCKDGKVSCVLDGSVVFERPMPKLPLDPGYGFGGGFDLSYRIKKLEVEGRLDAEWIRKELAWNILHFTKFKNGSGKYWNAQGNAKAEFKDNKFIVTNEGNASRGHTLVLGKGLTADKTYRLSFDVGFKDNKAGVYTTCVMGAFTSDSIIQGQGGRPKNRFVALSLKNDASSIYRPDVKKNSGHDLWKKVGSNPHQAQLIIDQENFTVHLDGNRLYRVAHGLDMSKPLYFFLSGGQAGVFSNDSIWFKNLLLEVRTQEK